uniref:Uncharacterized protein n=1 Tax=Acrobeloides nanus TaxID=290746 RepID=A0A914CUE5_9BILA
MGLNHQMGPNINNFIKERQRASNRLVLITLLSIFILEFIPNLIVFLFDKAHLDTNLLGPYTRLFVSFQLIIA